jgi:two-component system, LuxR family, response regulator FixJ
MREETVFIVDDDPQARELVAAIARSKGWQVREYESAEALLGADRGTGKSCVVLEVQLPGLSGLELQSRLAANGDFVPAVFVTAHGDVPTAVQAMQQGAVTFLQKPASSDALSQAIELGLRRSEEHYAAAQETQDLRDRFAQLTASERNVLERVIQGQPNKQIATEMDIGLRTVELRRSHIMRKTGAASLTHLIRLAIEVGFPDDLPPETARPAESAGSSADDVARTESPPA